MASNCGNDPSANGDGGISDGGISDANPNAPDADPNDLCRLLPNGPQWVIEDEQIVVQLRCDSGADLNDLEISNLPNGAVLDASANTITWKPALNQAAVYKLHVQSNSLFLDTQLQIGVADAFEHPDNQAIVDPSKYTMELGLPVLFIASEPQTDYEFEPMTITYGGVVHSAEAKLRGKSSLQYPKNSYALRFGTFDAFNETNFADFGNRRRVILTSTFDDNTYFRQRMAYNLWSRLNPTIKVSAYSVVVYRGTEYRGIYTATDHINADLMARSGLSNTGNLYKAENHDANFRLVDADDGDKSDLYQGYSKVEGTPKEDEADAFADMEDLVNFVATADDATFNAQIADRIEIDDYVAWWLLVTFIIADDSAGKNSYHYHDQSRKWRVAPWDFNSSFGQSWETSRTESQERITFFFRNRLFERLRAHPTIGPMMSARYQETLDSGVFSLDNLNAMINNYVSELEMSSARDWQRWEDEYNNFDRWYERDDFNSRSEEIAYVRSWIADRWQFARDNY